MDSHDLIMSPFARQARKAEFQAILPRLMPKLIDGAVAMRVHPMFFVVSYASAAKLSITDSNIFCECAREYLRDVRATLPFEID